MIIHLDIIVFGKVQGVFFRASTKAVADQLGVKGTIKNQDDGSVAIAAEADRLRMDYFLEWCNKGPDNAHVEKIEQCESELKNYRNFEIIKKDK